MSIALLKKSLLFFLIPCLFACVKISAQESHDSLNGVRQEDLQDVIKDLLHANNFETQPKIDTGKKVIISILPAAGYSLQTRFAVLCAGNAAFKIGNDPVEKISTIAASIAYTQNNQIIFPVSSSIWTKNNKYNLLGDWRATKYPQNTYGLGGHSSLDSADLINYDYIRFDEKLLRYISPNFYAGIGYKVDYHWNIKQSGNPGGSITDYDKYGFTDKSVSSGVSFNLLYDGRDNPINPSKNFYANIIYTDNLTALGSDSHWQSLVIDARKYLEFPAHSGNVLAFWNYDWLVLDGHPPYLDLPSTSWDPNTNTGRGYIQGRFRSLNMLYLETEYRYRLTKNGFLGAVNFINVQAFSDWPSNKFETLHPAVGAGLRVKLNKSSKTNLDLDYGFGFDGSHGLTVNLGEVF